MDLDNDSLFSDAVEYIETSPNRTIHKLYEKLPIHLLRRILIDHIQSDQTNEYNPERSIIKNIYKKAEKYRIINLLDDESLLYIFQFIVTTRNLAEYVIINKRIRRCLISNNSFIYKLLPSMICESEIKLPSKHRTNQLLLRYQLKLTKYRGSNVFSFKQIGLNSDIKNGKDIPLYDDDHNKKLKYFVLSNNSINSFFKKKAVNFNKDNIILFNQHKVMNLRIISSIIYHRMLLYDFSNVVSLDINIRINAYYLGKPDSYLNPQSFPKLTSLRLCAMRIIDENKNVIPFSFKRLNSIISKFKNQLKSLYIIGNFVDLYDDNIDDNDDTIIIKCPYLDFLLIYDYGNSSDLKIDIHSIKSLYLLHLNGIFKPSDIYGISQIDIRYFEMIYNLDYKTEWIQFLNKEEISTKYLYHPDIMKAVPSQKSQCVLTHKNYNTSSKPFKLNQILTTEEYKQTVDASNGSFYYPSRTWNIFNWS